MTPGKLYRVSVSVPIAHVRAVRAAHGLEGQKILLRDIEARLGAAGFAPTLSVTQDPTDNRLFRAISRFRGPRAAVDGLEILDHGEVEEPVAAPSEGVENVRLDPGLTRDEVWTLRQALALETNPRRLYGIAQTFAPFFPVACSLAACKATLIEGQAAANARDLERAHGERISAAVRTAVAKGAFADEDAARKWLHKVEPSPVMTIVAVLRSVGAHWPDVERAFRSILLPRFPWALDDRLRTLFGDFTPDRDKARTDFEIYASSLQASGKPVPLSISRDAVKRAICEIAFGQEESLSSAPRAVRELARLLATDIGYGAKLVLPAMIERAIPATGDEGFVSPSALQLMLATFKPQFAAVSRREGIAEVMGRLDGSVAPENAWQHMRAKHQLERAEKALERQRWVDWYRRARWQWS